MLFHLRGLVRAAAAAALAACCLAATACGSTPDPLAGLTATAIQAKVFKNFTAATSLKWDGTTFAQGQAIHTDVAVTSQRPWVSDGASYAGNMESCAGTARFTSADGKDTLGSYRFFARPADVYVSPDAAYWSRTSGLGSGKSYSLIAGKYLHVHVTQASLAGIAQQVLLVFCDRTFLMAGLNSPGTPTKGAVTTLDGTRVVPIKDSYEQAQTTEYVTDASTPEVVKASWHMPDVPIDGTYTLTVGAPVTVNAPPPAQVIPAASLGL